MTNEGKMHCNKCIHIYREQTHPNNVSFKHERDSGRMNKTKEQTDGRKFTHNDRDNERRTLWTEERTTDS